MIDEARAPRRLRRRERPSWPWALAGLMIVLAATVRGWMTGSYTADLTSARIGIGRVALVPVEITGMLLIGLGVLLFVAGLFAPLASTSAQQRTQSD